MQNYTFYAGQNSKFFEKRILISQKKNRKANNLGVIHHDSQLHFSNAQESNSPDNNSPKIKKGIRSNQQVSTNGLNTKFPKNQYFNNPNQKLLPNVNDSKTPVQNSNILPQLSKTGRNFNNSNVPT